MRLLGTDGAHLTRMAEDGTYLVPVVVAGATDPAVRGLAARFALPDGRRHRGLAAELGEPVWTADYIVDPRIPHDGNNDKVAERMGLRGIAGSTAPRPRRQVIGTLAISSATRASSSPRSATCSRAWRTRRPSRSPTLDPAHPPDQI
jgi:hypothetical protein